MTTDKEQEPIFGETDEMYKLTDLVSGFEFIDSKNLDYHIGGESEDDLENEVSNYLEDLNAEMVELVTFINENFKNIKIELPALSSVNRWIKHYKERKEQLANETDKYITQFWIGYTKGEYNECTSIIRILGHIKGRIES